MEKIMDNKLRFVFRPSLQHMALVKIATQLWTREDVEALLSESEFFKRDLTDESKVIIKMKEKVRSLHLPNPLKSELLTFIKPIGKKIFQWYRYLSNRFSLERMEPQELSWTPQGTIDKKKSAFVLVTDRSLKVETRFKLARKFRLIGKKMADSMTGSGELEKYEALESALTTLKSAPTKILPENLVLKERNQKMLVRYTLREMQTYTDNSCLSNFYSDFVCSSLSRLDPDQQVKIFQERSVTVLKCLLVWPYQRFFLETAKRMWEFIRASDFDSLLFYAIFNKIDFGSRSCVYRDIFFQFWELGSVEYRKYVIDDVSCLSKLRVILYKGEEEIFRMIWRELDAERKENLVCDVERGVRAFYRGIAGKEKWCGPSEKNAA